jgi:hypothetical protein
MHGMRQWHETTTGLIAFLILDLMLLYAVGSLAVARGNLWYYVLGVCFLIAAVQNVLGIAKKVVALR